MKKTTNNTTTNNKPMVRGKVCFYGKTKDYNKDKDILTLSIENPEFINVTEDSVMKMYEIDSKEELEKDYELLLKSKSDTKKNKTAKNSISGMYHMILKGESVERAFFHTLPEYEPDEVYTDNGIVDIADIEMNNATILMTLNKSYIGKIKVLENGTPYNPFE